MGRYATITGPLVGMAAAFTIGTYVSTNVRGKDDYKNYMVGATSAGCLWGALRRSYLFAINASLGIYFLLNKNFNCSGLEKSNQN